jgi:hypothetical protein
MAPRSWDVRKKRILMCRSPRRHFLRSVPESAVRFRVIPFVVGSKVGWDGAVRNEVRIFF